MKSIFEEEFKEYPDNSEPLWSFDWGAAMLIKFI